MQLTERLTELVAKRQALIKSLACESNVLVKVSLKRELKAVTKEAQRFTANIAPYENVQIISKAIAEGMTTA